MNTQAITRNRRPVTVRTHTSGAYVDGIYTFGAMQSYERMMAAVPVTTEDIKYFKRETLTDHGYILVEDMKFYDNVMDISIGRGDIIVKDGREYDVIRIVSRSDEGFNIYLGKLKL